MKSSSDKKEVLPGKGNDSFREHSDRMKEFRTVHSEAKTKKPKNLYCVRWFLIPLPPVDIEWYKLN
ncbi:MAG: hypothetical protein Q7R57_03295 [Dehalococcoidales bacterium]|nr:hypothetical protein [Dehalococcoidales bacterium]